MGARPYDPSLGRFLAVDPIDGGSLNNYDYADQDPIDVYDLTGTFGADLEGTSGGESGGGETAAQAEEDAKGDAGLGGEILKPEPVNNPDITFDREHATSKKHEPWKWEATPQEIENAIERDIRKKRMNDLRAPGDQFKDGEVTVDGEKFRYHAYRISPTRIHVGTYYRP